MAGGKKEHVERIKKSKFNRQRNDEVLKDNCKKDSANAGYVFEHPVTGKSAGQCEIHHVLPVSSLQDGTIKVQTAEDRRFIRNCMAMTEWDCNEQPNLIGLPTKKPYEDADRKLNEGKDLAYLQSLNPAAGKFGALPDLPCHLNEHDKYTLELINTLNADLWPFLMAQREPCSVRGKDIKQMLEDMSKQWKSWLKARGVGAANCWVNRETIPTWYVPLSMAPVPKKIKAPPRYMSAGGRAWRAVMFAILGR